MLYREIMAVCSEIHTQHISTVCGQNVELKNVKLVVHIKTTGLFKEPYKGSVTVLQIVTEKQHYKRRKDRQKNISNKNSVMR